MEYRDKAVCCDTEGERGRHGVGCEMVQRREGEGRVFRYGGIGEEC